MRLGEQGKEGLYFREQEQRPTFEGNRKTKTILGNREHKKTIVYFIFGEQGNQSIYFRGKREQHQTQGLPEL